MILAACALAAAAAPAPAAAESCLYDPGTRVVTASVTAGSQATLRVGTAGEILFGAVPVACGAGNDVINGNAGADQISGGGGNDRLSGGESADAIVGGPGADELIVGAENDTWMPTTTSRTRRSTAAPGRTWRTSTGSPIRLRSASRPSSRGRRPPSTLG